MVHASRRIETDSQCPVCLSELHYPVETNCGHLFCGWYFFLLDVSIMAYILNLFLILNNLKKKKVAVEVYIKLGYLHVIQAR